LHYPLSSLPAAHRRTQHPLYHSFAKARLSSPESVELLAEVTQALLELALELQLEEAQHLRRKRDKEFRPGASCSRLNPAATEGSPA
jgi:hypothetical protein